MFKGILLRVMLLISISFVTDLCVANTKVCKLFDNQRNITLTLTYKISVKGHLNSMRLKMHLPTTIKNRQTVHDVSFSIPPDSMYTINGNSYALYKLYDLDDDVKIVVKAQLSIYKNIANANDGTDTANLAKYLKPEPFIESNHPKILQLAAELKQKTDIETVMTTFFHVKDNVRYKLNTTAGAEQTLESGYGKCTDFSDLFVALLRANNIPAKYVSGMVVDYSHTPFHAWSEVYLKKQGWVLFDATTGQSSVVSDGNNYKMRIQNKYITLGQGRPEPDLQDNAYSYTYYYIPGSTIKVKLSYDMRE